MASSKAMGFLSGSISVVTGAGSGIGKGIAKMYGARNSRVAVCDLSYDSALSTVKEIEERGGRALAIKMDVTSEDEVHNGFEKIIKHWNSKRVDVLVSNAGFQYISPIVDLPFAEWKKMLDVHLNGAFLTTKQAMRLMMNSENGRTGGSIILMGSVHSKEASVLKSPYVTAKHGLIGLNKSIAKEGGPHNIRSNVVCPGFVLTPLVEKQIPEQAITLGISEEEVIKNVMLKNTVDGQFTLVEDIAEICSFLADVNSPAFTGQSITASHGWNMS